MRLRKIELVHSYDLIAGPGAFGPRDPNQATLALYADKVTTEELSAVKKVLQHSYSHSTPEQSVDIKLPFTISRCEYFDHSTTLAGSDGQIISSGSMEDRRALLLFSELQNGIIYMDIPLINEPIYRARKTPALRGGVPPFQAGGIYLELVPWFPRDASIEIARKITEFETPRHQEVLEGILAGEIKEYTLSPLYEHLHRTGQTDLWNEQVVIYSPTSVPPHISTP